MVIKYFLILFSLNAIAQSHSDIDKILSAQKERFKKMDQRMDEVFKQFENEHHSFFKNTHFEDDFVSDIKKVESEKQIKLILTIKDLKKNECFSKR